MNFKTLESTPSERIATDLDDLRDMIEFGAFLSDRRSVEYELICIDRKMTPLMTAVSREDLQCVQFLIESGADVNGRDAYGATATHVAVEYDHYQCLEVLLKAGADSSVPIKGAKNGGPYTNGSTPLHLAADNANINCVKELIRHGADINAVDENNATALYLAARSGHEKCVLALLDNAVEPRILSLPCLSTGHTPLHLAVMYGMVHAVKKLLELGADVNPVNQYGMSPLHVCTGMSACVPDVSFQVLKLLVLHSHDTDLNLQDIIKASPLQYAAFGSLRRHPEMALFLIAYGARIQIYDDNGLSLMQAECFSTDSGMAVLKACVGTLNVLPALNSRSSNNGFPLSYAARDLARMGISIHRQANPDRIIYTLDESNTNAVHKMRWYNGLRSNPLSLKHMCRTVVRVLILSEYKNLQPVANLPLPDALKSYIVLGAEVSH